MFLGSAWYGYPVPGQVWYGKDCRLCARHPAADRTRRRTGTDRHSSLLAYSDPKYQISYGIIKSSVKLAARILDFYYYWVQITFVFIEVQLIILSKS